MAGREDTAAAFIQAGLSLSGATQRAVGRCEKSAL